MYRKMKRKRERSRTRQNGARRITINQ